MNNKSFALTGLTVWLLITGIVPLILILFTSFMSQGKLSLFELPFTLTNYQTLLSHVFIKVFFRSLGIAMLCTLLCFLIAYPFSWLMVKSKHKSLLLLLIIVPFWTSSLIRTYAMTALVKNKGLVNVILMKCHLIHTPLEMLYTNTAVIIGLVYTLLPYMILPLYIKFEQFDYQLLKAAKDLGANNKTLLFKIVLPLTLPAIVAGCLLVLLPAMTLFYVPNILGGAKSFLLGNLIQEQILVLEHWPQGTASSVLLTGVLLLILGIYRHFEGKAQ